MSRKNKDWKKFGSPYDPSHGGKQRLNPEQEAKRNPQSDRAQLRGCGDPDCAACNPEVAIQRARSGTTSRDNYRSFFMSGEAGGAEESIRSAMEEMVRRGGLSDLIGRRMEFVMMDDGRPAKPAGPPPSYVEARKEVEDWLIKAPHQDFKDIIGNEEALEQLRDAIRAPVEHKALYEAYGMKMPKGALLSGPPGCGKTMFARAAASEMRKLYGEAVEFISISGSELQTMFVGQTEAYIKSIFTFAREYKNYHGHPLLVFMDEAEVLLPDRTGRVRKVAPWEESQVATFLAEMDGIQESGAFMLLATNRPEVIDQAVLRDGRCDFKVVVKRPTQEAIQVIVEKNFKDVPLAKGQKLADLVFAAVESLFDPHKILVEAHLIGINVEEKEVKHDHKHFLLEHIVSGAMAASIPRRSVRYAFSRDKAGGTVTGVTSEDVVKAVNDIFEENKRLEHEFALEEFRQQFFNETMAKREAERKGKLN
jgi:SpoVK/Ycf46/Vps4 family AAA+-type ATPase